MGRLTKFPISPNILRFLPTAIPFFFFCCFPPHTTASPSELQKKKKKEKKPLIEKGEDSLWSKHTDSFNNKKDDI